jgi:hypothetical protein
MFGTDGKVVISEFAASFSHSARTRRGRTGFKVTKEPSVLLRRVFCLSLGRTKIGEDAMKALLVGNQPPVALHESQ